MLLKLVTVKEPQFLYFKYDEWIKIKKYINFFLYFNKNYKECLIFKKSYKQYKDIVVVGLKWNGENVKRHTKGMAKSILDKGEITDCIYCSKELTHDNASIDHIIPIVKGGTNAQVNLIVCCKECNCERGHTDFYEYLSYKTELDEKIIWI